MLKLTITFTAVVIALGLRGLALVQAAVAPPHAPLSPAMLRLEFTWERKVDGRFIHAAAHSLATAVGPHTLLTHNHYPDGLGPWSNGTLALRDASGRAVTLTLAAVSFWPLDGGTLLIELPDHVTLAPAPVGGARDVQAVAPGDRLSVQFWDQQAGRIALADFAVVQVHAGVATLADPDRRINSGDSGGGVYRGGRLVGNTWSISTDSDCQPLGLFNVALLPEALSGAGASSSARSTGPLPAPEAVFLVATPAAQ